MKKNIIKNLFFKNKLNFWLVAFSIAAITMVTIAGIILSRKYIVHQAEVRIQDVLLEAEALHHYMQEEMHPAMYQLKKEGRIPQNFYSPEILSSSYISRHVFRKYNSVRKVKNLPLVEYRMASKNPRNKINRADSLEASLIDMFNNDSTIRKHTGIVNDSGTKHLYYAKPFLRIENKCLKCHGKKEEAPYELSTYYNWDSGFNLKVGEIPAVEIIKTPLIAEYRASSNIGIAILLTAIVLITLVILISRLSTTNKIINAQKDEIENTFNQLKNTQAQLLQSEKMASLGILTAGVAHEINNPLNFISGAYLGLESFFSSKAPESKKEVAALLKALKTGIERSTAIVQGLSQFSRDDAGYDDECNLHSIIDNCLLILKNKCGARIQIVKQYELNGIELKGNTGKLHQVFVSILLNAIQAIENNGTITIKTQEGENKIIVSIRDTGCGIEQENLLKIMDPFFTTKEPGEGIGLGLSITYKLIKEHKGDIEFISEPNTGTTVKITFPIT